ncbi:MAG: methyltransferase domain-containing protein [Roseiflexaceae bacterium]
MPTDYTEDFFEYHRDGARRSAQEIVPLVIDLVQPRSAIDVGCGSGSWLAVFKEYGILDVLGVDGSYIDSSVLEIPEDQFLAHDLRKPLEIDRQFDLVVSVEVAEHIPQEYAEIYINSLARLGPIVLFSAAIPLQGGTNHLNEQWPEYWVEHFEHRGYVIVDAIRKSVWQNDNIAVWYAQNVILFVRRDYLEDNLRLLKELENTNRSQLSIIHPKLFIEVAEKNKLHKEKAEFYIAEAEQLKADAHIHRQKIESYSAEVEQLKAEVQTHKAKAESYIAEVERLTAEH